MIDVTNGVVAWLEGLGVDAYHKVPATRPASFAVVDLAGNPSEETALQRATVTVSLFDSDQQRLRDMAYTVSVSRYALMETPYVFGTAIINEYDDYDHDCEQFVRVILLDLLVSTS